jgi:hypothetical protein
MLQQLIAFIQSKNGINNKKLLADLVNEKFGCTRDRAISYTEFFAIRFNEGKCGSRSVSNTVLSLSTLQKFDHLPVIICICLERKNELLLANTTMIAKLSHSAKRLRVDNIRGSFNASNIMRSWGGVSNTPENFEELFAFHKNNTFEENLIRIVETTNNIVPKGQKFEVTAGKVLNNIMHSPERAVRFANSHDYSDLRNDLNTRTKGCEKEILVAACIENVKVRGLIIEYLIAGEDNEVRKQLVQAIKTNKEIPRLKTRDSLGDYSKSYPDYSTETDIKTKIMILTSAPKGYNLDKMLQFLSETNTVFLIFFVGIDYSQNSIKTKLVSIFQSELIDNTVFQEHWAGRNSRGASQFRGEAVKRIILRGDNNIDTQKAKAFLQKIIDL